MGALNDHIRAGLGGGPESLNDLLISFFSGLEAGATGQVLAKQADGTNQYQSIGSIAGATFVEEDGSYATAATDAFKVRVSGDAQPRFVVEADGTLQWGNGTTAPDDFTSIYRAGANYIGVSQKLYANNIGIGGVAASSTTALALGPTNPSDQGLTIKGAASQSADLLKVQNSSSTDLIAVSPAGLITLPGATFATHVLASHVIGDAFKRFAINADGALEWGPGNGSLDAVIERISGGLRVAALAAATPLAVLGAASQTADLLKIQDSSSNNLVSFTSAGHQTFAEGINIITGTTTGTKIGTATTQKLGFFNATPVVRSTGWGAPTGTATRTTFATSTVTTAQLAERVKALIDDLTSLGLIGA